MAKKRKSSSGRKKATRSAQLYENRKQNYTEYLAYVAGKRVIKSKKRLPLYRKVAIAAIARQKPWRVSTYTTLLRNALRYKIIKSKRAPETLKKAAAAYPAFTKDIRTITNPTLCIKRRARRAVLMALGQVNKSGGAPGRDGRYRPSSRIKC